MFWNYHVCDSTNQNSVKLTKNWSHWAVMLHNSLTYALHAFICFICFFFFFFNCYGSTSEERKTQSNQLSCAKKGSQRRRTDYRQKNAEQTNLFTASGNILQMTDTESTDLWCAPLDYTLNSFPSNITSTLSPYSTSTAVYLKRDNILFNLN